MIYGSLTVAVVNIHRSLWEDCFPVPIFIWYMARVNVHRSLHRSCDGSKAGQQCYKQELSLKLSVLKCIFFPFFTAYYLDGHQANDTDVCTHYKQENLHNTMQNVMLSFSVFVNVCLSQCSGVEGVCPLSCTDNAVSIIQYSIYNA